MSAPKEIKKQVLGIKKTQKITDAMQKIAVNKMRLAQQRMETSMPYAIKIRDVIGHIASCNSEYRSPYLRKRDPIKKIGYIVISTDRGLCGGLNLNLLKKTLEHARQFQQQGIDIAWCIFGEKAKNFFSTMAINVVAHVSSLGESPKIAYLVGSIKIMLDAYKLAQTDRLFMAHNEFINARTQKPMITQLLPLQQINNNKNYSWDYIYEPEPKLLLDALIVRYVESEVYQAVVDNIACEQVARMLAMKNATDNAKDLIETLKIMYNKARQATITQELSEIIAGADAV